MKVDEEQLIGNFRKLVPYQAGYEIMSGYDGEKTHTAEVPSTCKDIIVWVQTIFREYTSDEWGAVCDCYILRIDPKNKVEMITNPEIEAVAIEESISRKY